jgi:hypothetical protein
MKSLPGLKIVKLSNLGYIHKKKKFLGFLSVLLLFVLSLILVSSLLVFTRPVMADYNTSITKSSDISVEGQIGEYYLNACGYISPYASIVMTTDGVFMRATVADKKGTFCFVDVLIKKGFSHFCLTAIDFKRLGESYTCFNFPPAKDDITMKDIFLPPTLGLSRTEIAENSNVIAFGYTMPGAKVTLHLSNGQTLTTYADENGYYEFTLKGLKAGQYELYATAEYQNKQSMAPTKKILLRSLSFWELFFALLKELWDNFVKLLTSVYLNPLWIAMPILISIIILILKIWPEKFTFIYNSKLIALLPKRKKKKSMHHDWFIGY